jgi:phosphatidylglycerol:prolipoprotein diacylglycerol transferase
MSPVLFELGPLTIRWYGLMYVVAIIVGIYLTFREVQRKGMKTKKGELMSLDDILDFVLISVPLGIVFARLYYVVFQWDVYGNNLLEILAIWNGGLAIHGGVIGGLLAVFIFIKVKGIKFWEFTDAVVPSLILGQVFGRFGNFMNGDAYGTPTEWWTGLRFPENTPAQINHPDPQNPGMSMPLHPSMLYELGGNAVIFGLLWFLRTKGYRDGFLTCMYFILYSVLRFFVEMSRGDSLWLVDGVWRAAQVISVILFVIFLGLMFQFSMWKRDEGEQPEKHASS